jgi:hypothetical protein
MEESLIEEGVDEYPNNYFLRISKDLVSIFSHGLLNHLVSIYFLNSVFHTIK